MGEYYKDAERCFSDTPKKVDKSGSIKQIFSGFNCFFVLDGKGVVGWGDNSLGQISPQLNKSLITSPQPIKIVMGNSESVQIISGSSTTFLLSGQRAELIQAENS